MNNIEPKKHTGLIWLWISGLIIVIDQITKYTAANYLIPYQPKYILPLLNFTLAYNPGASFNFLKYAGGWQIWLFVFIAIAISGYILRWLYRTLATQIWLCIALSLILGGAIGNLIDRLIHGQVIDFIQVHYRDWYFPTFNVADSAITIGATILILGYILTTHTEK